MKFLFRTWGRATRNDAFSSQLVNWEKAIFELLMIIFVIMWIKPSWRRNIIYKKAEMERRKEMEKREKETERQI